MLTRGFFATQEQASTNHKVYWHQIVACVEKNETNSIHSLILNLTFFADTLRSHFCSGAKKMSFVLMTDLPLSGLQHCAALALQGVTTYPALQRFHAAADF